MGVGGDGGVGGGDGHGHGILAPLFVVFVVKGRWQLRGSLVRLSRSNVTRVSIQLACTRLERQSFLSVIGDGWNIMIGERAPGESPVAVKLDRIQ